MNSIILAVGGDAELESTPGFKAAVGGNEAICKAIRGRRRFYRGKKTQFKTPEESKNILRLIGQDIASLSWEDSSHWSGLQAAVNLCTTTLEDAVAAGARFVCVSMCVRACVYMRTMV